MRDARTRTDRHFASIDWSKAPQIRMTSMVRDHLQYGFLGGHALGALVTGDLFSLAGHYDGEDFNEIRELCSFIYNELPACAFGPDAKNWKGLFYWYLDGAIATDMEDTKKGLQI